MPNKIMRGEEKIANKNVIEKQLRKVNIQVECCARLQLMT